MPVGGRSQHYTRRRWRASHVRHRAAGDFPMPRRRRRTIPKVPLQHTRICASMIRNDRETLDMSLATVIEHTNAARGFLKMKRVPIDETLGQVHLASQWINASLALASRVAAVEELDERVVATTHAREAVRTDPTILPEQVDVNAN